jgi:hypothetical protein
MPPRLQIGTQPALQERSGPIEQKPTLWSTAPGWRKLVIGSGVLTSLAVSAPILLPRPETVTDTQSAHAVGSAVQSEKTQQSCTAQMLSWQIPDAPQHVTARVTRMVPSAEVLARTRAVETQIGAKISPAYLTLFRVDAQMYSTGQVTLAAIPVDMTVKIGDLVELNSRYRDQSLPCHFIPWTINRVIEHKLN